MNNEQEVRLKEVSQMLAARLLAIKSLMEIGNTAASDILWEGVFSRLPAPTDEMVQTEIEYGMALLLQQANVVH